MARRAGTRPENNMVKRVIPAVKSNTCVSARLKLERWPRPSIRGDDPHQRSSPEIRQVDTEEAPAARKEQGFGQDLARQPRLTAPSETRRAISCCRAAPRASSRLATLAHATAGGGPHRLEQQQRPGQLIAQRKNPAPAGSISSFILRIKGLFCSPGLLVESRLV